MHLLRYSRHTAASTPSSLSLTALIRPFTTSHTNAAESTVTPPPLTTSASMELSHRRRLYHSCSPCFQQDANMKPEGEREGGEVGVVEGEREEGGVDVEKEEHEGGKVGPVVDEEALAEEEEEEGEMEEEVEVDENAMEEDADVEEMEAAEMDEADWSKAPVTEEDVHNMLHWMSPGAQQRRLQSLARQDQKFAVIQLAGKQYRVTSGDKIIVQSHFPKVIVPGTQIVINKILLVGGKSFTVMGRPLVTSHGATVLATVEEMTRARKLIVFKMKRRKRYRRWKTHRQLISVLNIDDVKFDLPEVNEKSEKIVAVE